MSQLIILLSLCLLPFLKDEVIPHENMPTTLTCKWASYPPQIDGDIQDFCWYEAEAAVGFRLLKQRGFAFHDTEVKTSYDINNLYILFLCYDSDPDNIRINCASRDGLVWRDDCVEVFIDVNHDHNSYYHLITNMLGTQYDEIGRLVPWNWDASWISATEKYNWGWAIELAIPFQSLGIPTPKAGSTWGFNVNRQDYQSKEQSGWAETINEFHEPQNFGHLLFAPLF